MTDHNILYDIRDELRAIRTELRAIHALVQQIPFNDSDEMADRFAAIDGSVLDTPMYPPSLPVVPYEQVAAMMGKPSFTSLQGPLRADDPRSSVDMRYPRFEGPTMEAAITVDASAQAWMNSPVMGAMPLPPKRGDAVFAVEGPNGELPSHIGTPGATNPDVTDDPAVLKATIGTPGWTATVRPPVSYTNALKIQVMAEYGIVGNPADFELDHLCPLCAGGSPTSQQNLWAQRRSGVNSAAVKDLTECAAQHAILSGAMSLRDVQNGFCADWTKLHDALFKNPKVVASMMMMGISPPEPEPEP